MRALGLGSLFRRSHAASDMRSSVLRPVSNPFLEVLDGKSSPSSARQMSAVARALVEPQTRAARHSSVDERPQFLFFCGSESIGERTPSLTTARANATLLRDSFQHKAAPVISHRMPVFFAAQCALPTLSPTSAGVRPSASIFN